MADLDKLRTLLTEIGIEFIETFIKGEEIKIELTAYFSNEGSYNKISKQDLSDRWG